MNACLQHYKVKFCIHFITKIAMKQTQQKQHGKVTKLNL